MEYYHFRDISGESDEYRVSDGVDALRLVEFAIGKYPEVLKRFALYCDRINLHRPWYWLQPECDYEQVMDSANQLYTCEALTLRGVKLRISRDERRQLLTAETEFVRALHFNRHIRAEHTVCRLSQRVAATHGVLYVWRGCDHQTWEEEHDIAGGRDPEWVTAIRMRREDMRLRQNTDDDLLYAREFLTSLEL
jgi:hypothetical protein